MPGSYLVQQGQDYIIGINKYFEIVEEDFDILGEHQSEWEWYEKGKDYQAFAVHRKIQQI